MSLEKYRRKRSFDQTPEPTGGKSDAEKLRFVIQKHAASHLHYDFRLEIRGVLKSWAVPKGPSTDPEVKRLAMMVEDHPYDYRNFEGIIPAGNYGAGTVIVWDEGFYEAAEVKGGDKKSQEKELIKELHAGKLKFILHGKKLKGEFALVKASGRGENSWLLMKLEDKYVSSKDITKNDKSVRSKKTLEQVKATTTNTWRGRPASASEKKVAKKTSAPDKKRVKPGKEVAAYLSSAPEGDFSFELSPMLATLVDKPFDKEGWSYEIKWDGYRTLAFIHEGQIELKSRNNKSFNEKFYPIYESLKQLDVDTIVDGEIVVTGENGISNFGALQNWRSEADGSLILYLFDILWLDGKDLTQLPLYQRREILKTCIPETENIRLSQSFDASGIEFFETALKMGLEGIIAKKSESFYDPGGRSKDWLKIKANKRQEVVIGGFTRNEGTNKQFSSLLVGVFEKKQLIYTGKIGTGFSAKTQKEMMSLFKPLITDKNPFTGLPDINKPSRFRPDPPKAQATWLKPQLICEVSYTEMTSDGVMRHPSFEGMRVDKKAADVILETEASSEKLTEEHKKLIEKKIIRPSKSGDRKTLLNPKDETQVRTVGGHELKFTNLSKVYWPKEKITKRDLINYYYQVAPYMLPYLKDRPQSLNRHPNGIDGKSFYQKNVKGKVPDWMATFPYRSEAENDDKEFLVCNDEATLLYMASLGCIEMNPWSSTVKKPDNPDWCIIDLDPAENTFNQVIQAAQVTHELLELLGVPSFCKTSGSTGLHIYIPFGAKYSYEQSKEFGRSIATIVQSRLPKFTSIERQVSKRGGKMYIDFLQNRPQATLAAPYSLRPKPGATVSMPLHWEEVKKGMKMTDFTIFNAADRLKTEGDIFKPVLGKGIDLNKVLKKLAAVK